MGWFSSLRNAFRLTSTPRGSVSKGPLADVIQPEDKSVDEIADMMDADYQVTLAVRAIVTNMGSLKVNISAPDSADDSRVTALVDQLTLLWNKTFPHMHDAIRRGRVAFEKEWCACSNTELNTIECLEPLPFKRTQMIIEDGEYRGVLLQAQGDVPIPADKTWWLALDATAVEPHGRSRYLGAPWEVFRDRKETKRLRRMFLKRFVIRGGVAHLPETARLEDGRVIDLFAATAKAWDQYAAGGLLMFPNDRDKDGNYDYDYVEPTTKVESPQPLDDTLDGQDAEQVRAFGFSEEAVAPTGEVGSFARVKSYVQMLYAVVEEILGQYVASFQRYVIDKVVEANWPSGMRPVITIAFTPLSKQPDSFVSTLVQSLLTTPTISPLVASGAIDLPQVLEAMAVPLTDDLDTKINAALQQAREATAALVAQPMASSTTMLPSQPGSAAAVTPTPAEDVASLALTGAQVTSLLDIVTRVVNKQLPPATAKATIQAAFPSLTPEAISQILDPAAGFTPAPEPGTQPVNATLANDEPPGAVFDRERVIAESTARMLELMQRLKTGGQKKTLLKSFRS